MSGPTGPYAPFPAGFPVLRGHGLTLRELAEEDLPAWLERLSDAEAAALAGDPVVTRMDEVRRALEHHRAAFRARSGLRWAIVPDDPGVSVGSVGFVRLDASRRTAEIGAAIGRAHWGRGIGTRAARLALDFGFASLALEAVEAIVLPENGRTRRILDRMGFVALDAACPADRAVSGRADSILFRLERAARPTPGGRPSPPDSPKP